MNIFVLSYDAREAAQMQCDMHVVKMTLETAQMLCAAYPKGEAPYRRTHYNHPCTVWSRESLANYRWLCDHGIALAEEYTKRFGKRHKSQDVIEWCMNNAGDLEFSSNEQTPFPLCMPIEYKTKCPVRSYRTFYIEEKMGFAKWNNGTPRPLWCEK